MARPWFFVDPLPSVGGAWSLPRDEAKHALGARRLEPGDEVILFDGRGSIAEAELGAERLRDGSTPVIVRRLESVPMREPRVHLVTALPKGDRLATLVDMTAQLGIASLTPLRCERSVVGETAARTERIRRIQVEACKQARRAWVPALHEECSIEELLRAPRGAVIVAHPGGEEASTAMAATTERTLCIGPEGGFSEREVACFRAAGASFIDLGPSILRIETAAVVAVARVR